MINPRTSADRSTTKPIAAFPFTPRVQEVHTKAEVVILTPSTGLATYFKKIPTNKEGFVFPVARPPPDHPPPHLLAQMLSYLAG